jgi:hypothetical protein
VHRFTWTGTIVLVLARPFRNRAVDIGSTLTFQELTNMNKKASVGMHRSARASYAKQRVDASDLEQVSESSIDRWMRERERERERERDRDRDRDRDREQQNVFDQQSDYLISHFHAGPFWRP